MKKKNDRELNDKFEHIKAIPTDLDFIDNFNWPERKESQPFGGFLFSATTR